MQFRSDPYEGMDHLQIILDRRLELMSIRYTHNRSFLTSADGDDSYSNVDVKFCDLNWKSTAGSTATSTPSPTSFGPLPATTPPRSPTK